MAYKSIPIVYGGLLLLIGLTPCPSNAQPTTTPPPPEQQGAADQPAMAPLDRPSDTSAAANDPAAYKRQVGDAVTHARKAELAGNEGNIPEMLRHTKLSLDQAQAAQRAGTNPTLDDGIKDLKETLTVGQRDKIAPSALRDARIKLSKVQTVSTTGISTQSRSGEGN